MRSLANPTAWRLSHAQTARQTTALPVRWLGVVLVLVAWELAAHGHSNPALVPPTIILPRTAGLFLDGAIWGHIAVSAAHVLAGFLLAVVLGFLLGVALTLSAQLLAALLPVIDAVRGVSALSLFPLIILLLGLGLTSKAFVIFWTAWPAVLLNTVSGIRGVDRSLIEAARLDTNSRFAITRRVCIPLAWPAIVTGLRVAMSGGWISLTAAEMLGGNQGLGYFILQQSQTFHFAEMYGGILTVALVGYLMNAVLWRLQQITELRI